MKNHYKNCSKSSTILAPQLSKLTLAIRASIISLSLVSGMSQAATIEVTLGTDDPTGCTLRNAIISVNTAALNAACTATTTGILGSNDSITFANSLSNNTISLSNGELSVVSDVSIDASSITGGITVNAATASRVFNVNNSILIIDTMTITGGLGSGGGGLFASNYADVTFNNSTVSGNTSSNDNSGGGLFASQSSITLNNSTVSDNNSDDYGGGISAVNSNISINNSTISDNFGISEGGGIDFVVDDGGTENTGGTLIEGASLSINNSTISGNSVSVNDDFEYGNAGGIYIAAQGYSTSVTINNSTISGNSAQKSGGAIFTTDFGGSISISISNSTVSDNVAAYSNGGLHLDPASTLSLSNSIIANSMGLADCVVISNATINIDTASIVDVNSCGVEIGAARTGDPGLNPLSDNGGLTETHSLTVNSTARNTGVLSGAITPLENCMTNDQRGQLRNDGDGACDVGAIEFNPNDNADDAGFNVLPLGNGKVVVIPL